MKQSTILVLALVTCAALAGLWTVGGSDATARSPGGALASDEGARVSDGTRVSDENVRAENVRTIARRIAERDTDLPGPIRNWYGSPDRPLLWADPHSYHAETLPAVLDQARLEGLTGAELAADEIRRNLDRLDAGLYSDSVRADAEVAVSTAFLGIAELYLQGSDRRVEMEVAWHIRPDSAPGIDVLSVVSRDGPATAVDSVRPVLPLYDRTVATLRDLHERRDEGAGWSEIAETDVAEPGDSMAIVRKARARLVSGIDRREAEMAQRGTDRPSRFDPDLARAIAHFQGRHGIEIDSVIGPETLAAMNVPLEERIDDLRVNLDRIRWLPRDMGERAILVNVAGFELRVLEDNRPVMDMGVVVGRPSWRTAVFDDTLEHLVVNPYWHVPESIEAEETLPKVRNDPDYLTANDISVVPEDANFGEPIDPSSIDWSSVSAASMPYDFRQEPGPENALGQIKFMFPNRHSIYLHDTPADELFRENFRAFSHGCIRVERPWELARYILDTSSHDRDGDLAAVRDSTERTRIDLDHPLPVYIAYLTSWVDEDGTVSFHRDLYDRDPDARGATEVSP